MSDTTENKTINSEIQRLKQNIANAYQVLEDNNVESIYEENSDNLDDNMDSVSINLIAVPAGETYQVEVDLDEYTIVEINGGNGNTSGDNTGDNTGGDSGNTGGNGNDNPPLLEDIDDRGDTPEIDIPSARG